MAALRLLVVLGAVIGFALCAGPARAFDANLGWGHVSTYWHAINEVVMSIAEHNALDDDWLKSLQDMPPADGAGKSAADVTAIIAEFRANLDKLNAEFDVGPAQVHPSDLAPDGSLSAAFLDTGFLLDALVLHVVKNDPVRVIGQYYPELDFKEASGEVGETYGFVFQANERIKAIFEEIAG